jgi:hypothetical protein
MELNEIKKLLEKYYEGSTSLEEENQLKKYFQNNEVPDELQADRELFAYVQKESSAFAISVGLEEKLAGWVDSQEQKEGKYRRMFFYLKIASIAAGIAIMIISYIAIDRFNSKKLANDTYKDPQLAYAEVKRTLLYISEQLNRGTRPLASVSKINEGMQGLSAFSSFGSGLKELELVSKYYDESNTENNNTK